MWTNVETEKGEKRMKGRKFRSSCSLFFYNYDDGDDDDDACVDRVGEGEKEERKW